MKSKISKKTNKLQEEMRFKMLNENFENRKRVYEVYIKALVKYNIQNVVYSAIMSDELYHNEIMRKMDSFRDNPEGFQELMQKVVLIQKKVLK